jgi:hypothetical protein
LTSASSAESSTGCPDQALVSDSSGSRTDTIMAVRVSADADGEFAGRAKVGFEAQAFMAGQR